MARLCRDVSVDCVPPTWRFWHFGTRGTNKGWFSEKIAAIWVFPGDFISHTLNVSQIPDTPEYLKTFSEVLPALLVKIISSVA